MLILVMICCFILSLSAVSAIDDTDNSTIVLEQNNNVIINHESNNLDIGNQDIVLSPIIGGKLKIIMIIISTNSMVKSKMNQEL